MNTKDSIRKATIVQQTIMPPVGGLSLRTNISTDLADGLQGFPDEKPEILQSGKYRPEQHRQPDLLDLSCQPSLWTGLVSAYIQHGHHPADAAPLFTSRNKMPVKEFIEMHPGCAQVFCTQPGLILTASKEQGIG